MFLLSYTDRHVRSYADILVQDRVLQVVEPVTGERLAEHTLVAPGETSILDDHYGGPRPERPRRAARPRTVVEKAFLGLGPGRGGVLDRGRRGRGHQAER